MSAAVVQAMFWNTLKLFLKGKLFRDARAVWKQWLLGFAASLCGFAALVLLGAPLWLAVPLVAFGAGLLQPWLFRDLKYN